MSQQTLPIFIVGSGRCGTRMVAKLLAGAPATEVHHEYLHTHIQPVACCYAMGVMDATETKRRIAQLHGAGIFYAPAATFIDVSNKASWVIPVLNELFPQAKFVHLIRDGRKVVSSFFHKLSDEIYPDDGVAALQAWLRQPQDHPMPPPEKKYWWKIPPAGQPYHEEFNRFSQFQRICYHWQEVNRTIARDLAALPPERTRFVRLEELVAEREALTQLLEFLGIPFAEHQVEFVKKPDHVFFPIDFKLTAAEQEQFNAICGPTMAQFGYGAAEEYTMKY